MVPFRQRALEWLKKSEAALQRVLCYFSKKAYRSQFASSASFRYSTHQPPYSARAIEAHGDEIAMWPYHLPYYRNVMLGWEELPNKDFPIIFHPVYGKDEREGTSPSFFNVAEVETIERYLRKLLDENVRSRGLKHLRPEMIGIISPYKRQVRASVKFEVESTSEAKLEPVINRKLSNIWQVFIYEVTI